MKAPLLRAAALGLGGLLLAPWLGPAIDSDSAPFILWELRWPRAVLGGLVGASLVASGAAYQVVLENPLATPSTMGTTAGAALGALAILVLAPAHAGAMGVALGAFAGVSAGVGFAFAASRARFTAPVIASSTFRPPSPTSFTNDSRTGRLFSRKRARSASFSSIRTISGLRLRITSTRSVL